MEDADPGHRPMVLVMFAALSDSSAMPVSVGNDKNVPPPAIELIAAATKGAVRTRSQLRTGICKCPHLPPFASPSPEQDLSKEPYEACDRWCYRTLDARGLLGKLLNRGL